MAAYSTGADVRWAVQCSPSFRRGPGLSSQPSPAGGCGSLAFLSSPALCAGLVLRGCAWWAAGALEGAQRLGEASRPSLRTCRAALESPGRLTRCPAPHRRPPGPAPQGGLRTPGRQGPRDSGAPEKPRNRAPSRGGSCLPNPRAHLNRAAGRAAGGREMQGSQRGMADETPGQKRLSSEGVQPRFHESLLASFSFFGFKDYFKMQTRMKEKRLSDPTPRRAHC